MAVEVMGRVLTKEQITSDVKELLYPIYKHRTLLEKAKYRYRGQEVLGRQEGNDYITSLVGRPAAVAKMGASEVRGLRHYLGHRDARGNCKWWGQPARELYRNTGVYPPRDEVFSRFCEVYFEAMGQLDVLGVWYRWGESMLRQNYAPRATLVPLPSIEPYYWLRPWTQALKGKRVLVVTPFARTVLNQYQRRQEVWRGFPDVMPEFAELRTIRTPLSAALLSEPEYPDWFIALDALKKQMEESPFDVCIVGAGAWSVPIAAHAKKLGAMGVHMGGPTQVLFGIKGQRWEKNQEVQSYVNESWTRPQKDETPGTIRIIENGCYW